jgi:hypothetical protein
MNKVAAGVEVASAFPRLICQGSARPVPSTRYHLINTPTPPFFIFKTLQIISEPPCKPEIRQVVYLPRLKNQLDWGPQLRILLPGRDALYIPFTAGAVESRSAAPFDP